MKNRKGFTFIELCIAVVIFSVVAIAVYSCFTTGMLAWKKTESSSCLYQDARVTLELMANELRNSLASDKWIFEGQAKEMGFVLLASPPLQKKSAFGNIYKVRYYLEDDKLMRHQKDLKALLGEGGTESASEELIQNVKSLNLEYRYKSEDVEGSFFWQGAWLPKEKAPKGVRITIILKPDVTFTKYVIIPTGVIGAEEVSQET